MRRRLVSALLAVLLAGQGALAWGGTAIAAITADTSNAAGAACAMACCKRVGGMHHAAMAGRSTLPGHSGHSTLPSHCASAATSSHCGHSANSDSTGVASTPAEPAMTPTPAAAPAPSCAGHCGWSRGHRAAGTLVPTAPFLLPAAVRLPAPAGHAPRALGLTPAVGDATPSLPERPPRA